MSAEIRVFTPEQAFTVNRFQKLTALFSFLDTCARSGNPQEISKYPNGSLFRDGDDKPFSLFFGARGVYGVDIMRRGYQKQMQEQGMTDVAEEITQSYQACPLRNHIARNGDY